ncbi:hypothetical protein PoB_001735700 [Plakobranchus ocellatus]|uniref:Uncharacterized protein n=1 Tax=Plakobranchus ocellatus TaxID=259542 RepID=A0AAV3Z8P9_9GAST|nr:hypothetical protein PoB_001735700 [Plakobranchus ocellatus]
MASSKLNEDVASKFLPIVDAEISNARSPNQSFPALFWVRQLSGTRLLLRMARSYASDFKVEVSRGKPMRDAFSKYSTNTASSSKEKNSSGLGGL